MQSEYFGVSQHGQHWTVTHWENNTATYVGYFTSVEEADRAAAAAGNRRRSTSAAHFIPQGHFDRPWDCWHWPLGLRRDGYPNGASHRKSYEYHVGPIPDGHEIDHTCHSRDCWNPYHLVPVPHNENVKHLRGIKSNNTSGYRGVMRDKKSGKWKARVRFNGVSTQLGLFEDPAEAGEAVRQWWSARGYRV